jgi:hypothetical protein
MGFLESGACLVQLMDHLQQVRHAFRGFVVEPVSFLFVVDDEAASGLVESATYFLVQDPKHKEGSTFLRVCVR